MEQEAIIEETKSNNVKKNRKSSNEKVKKNKGSFKSYLRDFLVFVDKKLIKTTAILFVVAILLFAISLKPIVTIATAAECEGTCRDGITFLSDFWERIKIIGITGIAGIVPYVFASVLGYIGYIVEELSNLAYIIKGYGYLFGILRGIVPLILNLISICLTTALGIYLCKTVTVSYKISSLNNMNFTNFRIKLYEVLRKEEKIQALTKTRDGKIEKLQAKKEKINYLQILNTSLVVIILQFISVVIQHILV